MVDTTHRWRVTQTMPQVFSKLFLPHVQFYSFSAARFCRINSFLPLLAAGDLPLKCPIFHYGA
jgi:hypothetical protein